MMRLKASLIATGFGLVLAIPVAAQDHQTVVVQSQTQSVERFPAVQRGNTTIVFAPADNRDIDTSRFRTWEDFADTHSGIAHTLAYKPSLINDPLYLKGHPDLNSFFQAHPDIKLAMEENPGNFTAIPPRPGE